MTDASLQAFSILRSPDQFQWYVIPLLAAMLYIYMSEVYQKRWDIVLVGLLFILGEFFWEIINALILHFTQYAALWSCPGNTAYLILVGINIEIFFMFSVAGIIFVKSLPEDKNIKIFGVPNRMFIPFVWGVFCICVETILNKCNALVWEYRCWGNWPHIWSLIINYMAPFYLVTWGHFHFSRKLKIQLLYILLSMNIIAWILFVNILEWI